MRNYVIGLGILVVCLVWIFHCGNVCQVKRLNAENEKQLQYWSGEYDALIREAAQALNNKRMYTEMVKHGSGMVAMYPLVGRAYADWDEGIDVPVPPEHTPIDLELMARICKVEIHARKSPLCDNWDLYYKGKEIFEAKGVSRPIALGIMYAESHIGANYAGTCDTSWNNWGGIKWRKNDDGTTTKDQVIPNDGNGKEGGCWLYKFDSVEDYFRSKANTLGLGYTSCFTQDEPIKCISFAYVGNRYVAEQSWISRVAIIAY